MTEIAVGSKIHLTETPPVACSSCGGQYTDRRHVDFGAAGDYGMIPNVEVAGGKLVSLDDLVICEECLTFAASLVDLGDVTEHERRIDALNERLTDTGQRLGKALDALEKMEQAVAARTEVKHPVGRPKKTE